MNLWDFVWTDRTFGKRGNLVKRLSTAVDKSVGKRGAFMRAARALEKDRLVTWE